VKNATAHLDATVHARTIAATAHLEVPGAGAIDFTTSKILIGGKAPVVASWRRIWGKVKFDGHADLTQVAALLPARWVPLDEVHGTMTLSGRLERDGMDDMTPGVVLSLQTHGLTAVAASTRKTDVDGSTTFAPPAWRADGIDLALDVDVDGTSGFADVSLRLVDPKGELVTLDLKSQTVPFANLLATPAQALSVLEQVQMNARVAVPRREIASLPAMLAIKGAKGTVEADVSVSGSAEKPTVDFEGKLSQVRARAAGLALPVDFALAGHYDGAHMTGTLSGDARKKRVLDAHFAADAVAAELLRGDTSSWTASGGAHLDALPIEALAALNDRQVKGSVSGDVSLDGLHTNASAKAALSVDNLKVGDVAYKSGKITATLDGAAFSTDARLDQDDGYVDAHLQAGQRWGTALTPTPDPTKNLDCTVTASRFRAALLLPFVDTVFTELDARIDAKLTATLDPRTRTARMSGTASMDQGRFELASIGGEFHDATMKLTFTPDGVVKIENVRASGMSGRIEAAASARLDNFALAAANATVLVPDAAPLLLTVEGSQVGTIVGRMDVTEKLSGDKSTMSVTVKVPKLHVELPLTTSRDVQALGPMDGVRIGTIAPKGFVAAQLDAPRQPIASPPGKTLQVTVDLGQDVEIKRGATLKIALAGKPAITVDESVHASGQIRLLRGTLDVQGKSFTIENGTVTFVGDDATNPQVVVTATWDAPDGTRVYADFVGPLKTGKVTLRSEPSLPNNEILALILFGTPDGLTPASQSGSSTAGSSAAGAAGSAAAQPLNQALESYGLGGVTTRVDTSTANPRPEVEVQIARDISLQVAYVIGTPPPGTNPDSTLFTLNWRFIRQWSLETTIGSAGTSILDLIWQYRY
jgi:translocation and assembly module TamB